MIFTDANVEKIYIRSILQRLDDGRYIAQIEGFSYAAIGETPTDAIWRLTKGIAEGKISARTHVFLGEFKVSLTEYSL